MSEIAQGNPTVEKLKERFAEAILDIRSFRDELTVIVDREKIVEICSFLKEDEDLSYNLLSDLCGADYLPREPRFEVIYNLISMKNKVRLRLKVLVPGNEPTVQSVTSVWGTANWHERETYDMYGIVFKEHPDLRRIYMPEDYIDFPLRKDFPLMGRD